jgi:hypothetical protein
VRNQHEQVLTDNAISAWGHIPEDGFLHSHCRENLKSYKIKKSGYVTNIYMKFHHNTRWWGVNFTFRCIGFPWNDQYASMYVYMYNGVRHKIWTLHHDLQ